MCIFTEKLLKDGNFKVSIVLWALTVAFGIGLQYPACGQETDVAPPLFSFGIVADVQYGDCDTAGSRYYRVSMDKLTAAVNDFNGRNLAFVINLGDIIERKFGDFDPILTCFERLKAPRYYVLGNHDRNIINNHKDKNAATALLRRMALNPAFYDFSVQSWRFIVLDCNHKDICSSHPDAGANWNPDQGEQIKWLMRTLRKAQQRNERTVVFGHQPLLPNPEDADYMLHLPKNAAEILAILESFPCVTAYLSGHYHKGWYGTRNGIHHLVFKGMVETADQTAYAVVEVSPSRLMVKGVGIESNLIMRLSSQK